jgi:hypothetical protein
MFIGSFFILYSTVVQFTGSNTILDMRTAYWITKATRTFKIRSIYCFTTATVVKRKNLNVMLHVYCLSCYVMFCYYFDGETIIFMSMTICLFLTY